MAVLVLMTGIHLSLSSHFCSGQLTGVKFSITGKSSSCGMEREMSLPLPASKSFKTHCCTNELTTLSVDSNYSPSFTKSLNFYQKVLNNLSFPLTENLRHFVFTQYSYPILSPPGISQYNTVELEKICVFLI